MRQIANDPAIRLIERDVSQSAKFVPMLSPRLARGRHCCVHTPPPEIASRPELIFECYPRMSQGPVPALVPSSPRRLPRQRHEPRRPRMMPGESVRGTLRGALGDPPETIQLGKKTIHESTWPRGHPSVIATILKD